VRFSLKQLCAHNSDTIQGKHTQEYFNSRTICVHGIWHTVIECSDRVGPSLNVGNGRRHGTDGDADEDGSGDESRRRQNSITPFDVTSGPGDSSAAANVTSTRCDDVGCILDSGPPGTVPTSLDDGPAT